MTMRDPADAPRRRHPNGFIIVAVLWILAALATLASIFSIYLANTAVFLSLNDNAIQTEALVSAGLQLAAYQVSAPKPDTPQAGAAAPQASGSANAPPRPTRGAFNFRLARANVAVDFISEAARIDLNSASPQLLANFLTGLGVQRQQAEQYAKRIQGWITTPKGPSPLTAAQDDEEALYRAAGRSYSPRGGPFAHIDELSLVLDLPSALIERAKPYLTVYSGTQQINVLDAAPEVLAAIPGMTPDLLNTLIEARRTAPNPQAISRLIGGLSGVGSVEGSDAYRVQVRIRYDDGRQDAAEVVILTGLTDKPYRVLSWRDGSDALSGPDQPFFRPR